MRAGFKLKKSSFSRAFGLVFSSIVVKCSGTCVSQLCILSCVEVSVVCVSFCFFFAFFFETSNQF